MCSTPKVEAVKVPEMVPVARDVSEESKRSVDDSMYLMMQNFRKKQGYASTVKGGFSDEGSFGGSSGKTYLGE